MRAEISRLAGIVRTFINIQLSPEIFPPLAKGKFFFKKKTIGSKEDVRKKEENLELWRGQDRNSGEAEAKQVIQGDFSLSSL